MLKVQVVIRMESHSLIRASWPTKSQDAPLEVALPECEGSSEEHLSAATTARPEAAKEGEAYISGCFLLFVSVRFLEGRSVFVRWP